MAATGITYTNTSDKQKVVTHCYGEGAIASTDALVTDTNKFPIGSTYFDKAARIMYHRVAAAGAIADWAKAVALTLLS